MFGMPRLRTDPQAVRDLRRDWHAGREHGPVGIGKRKIRRRVTPAMSAPKEDVPLPRGPQVPYGLADVPVHLAADLGQHITDQHVERRNLGTSIPVPVNDPVVSPGDDPVGGGS